jgi:hypothetical protein
MDCHYISTQLERIEQAKAGAEERLATGGSSGLEEQLRAIEEAVSNIRDEMSRRAPVAAPPNDCFERSRRAMRSLANPAARL